MLQGELAPQLEDFGLQNLFWQLPGLLCNGSQRTTGALRHLLQTRAGQRSSVAELMMRDPHW
jgi:hypothetical protein